MKKPHNLYLPAIVFVLAALLGGCAGASPDSIPASTTPAMVTALPQASPSPTDAATLTQPPTATELPTETFTLTATSLPSETPSPSPSPTITGTPAPAFTATFTVTATGAAPAVSVKMQANCRYGPSNAYLYRWGLYPGDTALVDGKNYSGTWYWIKPHNLDVHCWASEMVFNEDVDLTYVPVVNPWLPKTTFAGPPGNVQVSRSGDEVTVSWDVVVLSDDKRRGYLLEVTTCQNGVAIYQPVHTDDTAITFTDSAGCGVESGGLLYTAEKHGYSEPVTIPWP